MRFPPLGSPVGRLFRCLWAPSLPLRRSQDCGPHRSLCLRSLPTLRLLTFLPSASLQLCFLVGLLAFELGCSFFQIGFHAFLTIFAAEGLGKELSFEGQAVGQR